MTASVQPALAPPAVDLDAILLELGQFGRYQIQNYCLILLPIIFSAIYNAQYIFAAGTTDHRCIVPECESPPVQWEVGGWAAWALPEDGGRCDRLLPLGDACLSDLFHVNDTVRCDAWVYENNNTIVSTFGLACEEWKRTLVGTIHSVGLFAALPLTGYLSDTFGRRTTFVLTSVAAAVMGMIRAFSNNYVMYVSFEFLDAMLGSGVYSTGFILGVEMVGLKMRVLGGNIVSCSFALGQVILALVAWVLPYWRTLTLVIYAPSLLFIFYFFVLEESVRWLLSRNNRSEAARIIFKAAATNKRKLSPETIKLLSYEALPQNGTFEQVDVKKTDKLSNEVGDVDEKPKRSLFGQVIRSRVIMFRVCVCSFWWITTTFTYYGLSINAVSLAGNMYVNYILTALIEIPGYALSVLTLDRFGRKKSIMTAYIICGLSLIIIPFVPEAFQWAATSLNLVGKLCISMAFSSIYIYTSELFPTSARHRLLAFCSMVGRIGNIVAPQTPLLMNVMASLPYLIFGVMAVTSALLMLLTPETLNRRLPDTVEEAEEITKSNSKHLVNSE